jgi:hypothetical protein
MLLNDLSIKKVIKIIFNILLIVLIFVLGWRYILGVVLGMALMSYLILFPTPMMLQLFDKLFGYDYYKTMFMRMKNDTEKTKHEYETRFKVKYKK